jgi:Uma2 family endonuclease
MHDVTEPNRMTVDEFVCWDDGTDTRYELENGVVHAMAPPGDRHGTILGNITGIVARALVDRPPCPPVLGGGVRIDEHRYYIPDLVVTCVSVGDGSWVQDARILVEILSSSARGVDRQTKLPSYMGSPTICEIWHIHADLPLVGIWYRREDHWDGSAILIGKASFRSEVLDQDIPLEEVYRLTSL